MYSCYHPHQWFLCHYYYSYHSILCQFTWRANALYGPTQEHSWQMHREWMKTLFANIFQMTGRIPTPTWHQLFLFWLQQSMITALIKDNQSPYFTNKCTVYRVDLFTTILFVHHHCWDIWLESNIYSCLDPIFVCQTENHSIHICRLTGSPNLAAFPNNSRLLIWLVGPTVLIRTWTHTGDPVVPPSKFIRIHDRTHRQIIHNHPPMNLWKTGQTIPPGDVLLLRWECFSGLTCASSQQDWLSIQCQRCRKRKIKCSGDDDGKGCLNCQHAGQEPGNCQFLRVWESWNCIT